MTLTHPAFIPFHSFLSSVFPSLLEREFLKSSHCLSLCISGQKTTPKAVVADLNPGLRLTIIIHSGKASRELSR